MQSRVVSRVGFRNKRGWSIWHSQSAERVLGGNRRGQHRVHADAACRGKFLNTGVRHFRLRAVRHLSSGVVKATGAALLISTRRGPSIRALSRDTAHLAAVHIPVIALAANVEDLGAGAAPSFPKRVVRERDAVCS